MLFTFEKIKGKELLFKAPTNRGNDSCYTKTHTLLSGYDIGTMYKNRGSLVKVPEARSWMNLAIEYRGLCLLSMILYLLNLLISNLPCAKIGHFWQL